MWMHLKEITQLTFTYSKSTIETLEKVVKYVHSKRIKTPKRRYKNFPLNC